MQMVISMSDHDGLLEDMPKGITESPDIEQSIIDDYNKHVSVDIKDIIEDLNNPENIGRIEIGGKLVYVPCMEIGDPIPKAIIQAQEPERPIPDDVCWPYDHPAKPFNVINTYLVLQTIVGLATFIAGVAGYGEAPTFCICFGTMILIVCAWGLGLIMGKQ